MTTILEICKVPNYKVNYSKSQKIIKPLDSICALLEQDFQLHERLRKDDNLILTVDVDNLTEHNSNANLEQILNDVSFFIGCQKNEISYTTNFSKETGSHHLTIPKFWMSTKNQKQLWIDFKKKYNYGKEIDSGIFDKDGWFRLPNQTKENIKGTEHIIQQGEIKDFLLKYIDEAIEYKKESLVLESTPIIKNDIKKYIPTDTVVNIELPERSIIEIKHYIDKGCFKNRCNYGSHLLWISIAGIFKFLFPNEWINLWTDLTIKFGTENKKNEFQEKIKDIKEIGNNNEMSMNTLRMWAKEENYDGWKSWIREDLRLNRLDKNNKIVKDDDSLKTDVESVSEIDDDEQEFLKSLEEPDEPETNEPNFFDKDYFNQITIDDDDDDDDDEFILFVKKEYPVFEPFQKIYDINLAEDLKEKNLFIKKNKESEKKYDLKIKNEKKMIDDENRKNEKKFEKEENDKQQFRDDVKNKNNEKKLFEKRKKYFEKFHCKIISPCVFVREGTEGVDIINKTTLINSYENLNDNFIYTWLKSINMRTYEYVNYFPPPKVCPDTTYNLYSGLDGDKLLLEYKINEKLIKEKISIFLKQFWLLTGKNNKGLEYVLNYLAHIIQKPGELPRTSIVFKSQQGVGKNLAFEQFSNKLLGTRYLLSTQKIDQILGRFPLINQKLLVLMDEASGKDTFSNSEAIKSYITAETLTYEKKGVDGIQILNTGRMIFLTNNEKSVKIEQSDRRFSVFESSNDVKNNTEYFTKLLNAYEDKELLTYLFYFFKNRDISKFDPTNDRVKTNIYLELKNETVSDVTRFILYKFDEDWIDLKTEFIEELNIEDKPDKLLKSDIYYNEYKDWCRQVEYKPKSQMYFIKTFIKNICKTKRTNKEKFITINVLELKEFVKNNELIELDEEGEDNFIY